MVALAVQPRVNRHAYQPRGGCRELFLATDPEVVAVGPAGTGKTMSAVMKLHLTALHNPGVRILMVRKVLEDLKTGALHTYVNKVQPEAAGVKTFGGNRFYPAEFRYPSGSVILVVGMDKPGKVMSAEYDIIFCNESTELSEADWQALKTRLRNGRLPYQMLMGDCNPSGPRHWLRQRAHRGQLRMIQTTHRDNPAYWDAGTGQWTTLGQQYVRENLAGLTGVEYDRLYKGVWAAAEGLVYKEFNPELHVRPTIEPGYRVAFDDDRNWLAQPYDVPPTSIVEGWRTVMGVDIGSRNPTAILTGHVAGDERGHISREIYRRNMTASDILSAIKAEADRANPDAIYIDPSAKGYIDDLRRAGYPAVAANNDVRRGIQHLQAAFAHGLTIDPSCVNLIDELGMYAYPDNSDGDKPIKDNDHACDAARYLWMGVATPRREVQIV